MPALALSVTLCVLANFLYCFLRPISNVKISGKIMSSMYIRCSYILLFMFIFVKAAIGCFLEENLIYTARSCLVCCRIISGCSTLPSHCKVLKSSVRQDHCYSPSGEQKVFIGEINLQSLRPNFELFWWEVLMMAIACLVRYNPYKLGSQFF